VSGHTVVATANILRDLRRADARSALEVVLDHGPDLVGLQEWGVSRRRLLAETGELRPRLLAGRLPAMRSAAPGDYLWASPVLGECPVGARSDRFELLRVDVRPIAGPALADAGARAVPVVPPRAVTVAVFGDKRSERTVAVVNYHLTPGVQARGRYRTDRPRLVGRHRHEVRVLTRVVQQQLADGHTVYAVGDSNFDGLRLPGLTSAWEGREDEPGTLGPRRKIDDVHGPGPAEAVTLLSSASDHKAVLVRRPDR
jgi:endonuclease/exonuclease/phosphatase family metal-dependent hydrolase